MYEPIKSLGQNFLLSSSVVELMIDSLELADGDDIIEIGPGHGILTDALVHRITDRDINLYAVEIDERFSRKLFEMYVREPNIEIIQADILDWLPNFESNRKVKVFGSLPYYITSPILHSVIKMKTMPKLAVFLIQKEVADKVCSKVPDSSYLSVFVQTFYEAEFLLEVPRKQFTPPPKVDGGVIKLIKKNIDMDLRTKESYEGFLHRGFSHPRKMLNKPFSREELERAGMNPRLRPQNLSADEWRRFYEIIHLKHEV